MHDSLTKQLPKFLFLLLICFIFPTQAKASHPQVNNIYFQNPDKYISIPTKNDAGGLSLAVSDLGSDGIAELIVGPGLGNEPRIRVLRLDGSEIGSFLAYTETLGVGINVTACDLNGDGLNEIVTAPQYGGGPHVRIFDGFGKSINSETFAYNSNFRGGVNLTCGDVLGDSRDELITLPGASGGPHVRVWNLEDDELKLTTEFFAFDQTDRSGLVGAISNRQLTLSQQKTNTPIIKTFSLDEKEILVDERKIKINATGISSLVIHNQQRIVSTTSNNIFYNIDTKEQKELKSKYGSTILVSGKIYQDKPSEILFTDGRVSFNSNETKIIVDVSDQRLYAYTNGILENSFLVSSGLNNATPLGNHSILAKIYEVDYRWSYGPNDPRNYDLGVVPYNLRFFPHIYLHYAYWHNNFGHPMSHGCVNVSLTNMKWLYDWAQVGIPVTVVQ